MNKDHNLNPAFRISRTAKVRLVWVAPTAGEAGHCRRSRPPPAKPALRFFWGSEELLAQNLQYMLGHYCLRLSTRPTVCPTQSQRSRPIPAIPKFPADPGNPGGPGGCPGSGRSRRSRQATRPIS